MLLPCCSSEQLSLMLEPSAETNWGGRGGGMNIKGIELGIKGCHEIIQRVTMIDNKGYCCYGLLTHP